MYYCKCISYVTHTSAHQCGSLPLHPSLRPQQLARRSSRLLSNVWSSSHHKHLRKPGVKTHTGFSTQGSYNTPTHIHHLVSYLPSNDCDFWNRCFCKSIQQFGSMSDDAAVLLSCACRNNFLLVYYKYYYHYLN